MFNLFKKMFIKPNTQDALFFEDQMRIQRMHRSLMDKQIAFQEEMQKTLEPFGEYLDSLQNYFDEQDKLQASVEMARACGVPEDKILHNYEEGEAFFMT